MLRKCTVGMAGSPLPLGARGRAVRGQTHQAMTAMTRTRRVALGSAVLLAGPVCIAAGSDRVLVVVNGPGVGTLIAVCGLTETTEGGRLRRCGTDYGTIMEDTRLPNGAVIRKWFPGGWEYFREYGREGEPLRTAYRAVRGCWANASSEQAGGPSGPDDLPCAAKAPSQAVVRPP